ncbi:MAG: GNAT family N-acetyltransferase [Anaerolineae bacterium]|nr:GNAT family N-acetyltransferase [Anaerolineae bacterium]
MATDELKIERAHTPQERMEFARFPWRVYKNDPNWVPPLVSERVEFLDPQRHPFYEHADVVLFLARRGSEVVGTIAALVNHLHNEFWNEKVGFFGLFEVLEDRQAAEALLNAACDWVRAQGMDAIRGPANFSTNEEIGLLVDGWDGPPVIMMTYNPRYYVDFIEGAGFFTARDLVAYMADLRSFIENGLPERTLRVAEKVRKQRSLSTRTLDMRRFDQEVQHVKRIYNSAWARNWGFVPMTDHEIDHIAVQLKQILDPDLCHFILKDGEEIGFALILPNLNTPLLKAYPHPDTPEWWTMLKMLWHWKVRRSHYIARAYAGGIIDPHRGSGADVVMAVAVIEGMLKKGYRYCETSWVLEDNLMMRRMAEAYNSVVYRTYRVYEKTL